MRVQHNIMAMNAYRNYTNNTKALSGNLEKLSSGYKINRAGDDAAGLAISEKMRAQIKGLEAAQKNVKDGTSLVKTAEGAMQEIQDMLKRMDYLATQSANGTYDNEVDRLNLNKEVDALKTEIDRIADSANFNGIKLMDGSLGQRSVTYKASAQAYDVQSIQIMGGGPAAADDNTNGPQNDALTGMKAEVTGTADKATVTLTLKKDIAGIKWVAVGQEGGNKEMTGTDLTAEIKGGNGGSVTFKAMRDETYNWDTALSQDVEFYEGMTITVAVDRPEYDSNGAFVGYGDKGLETDSVGKATGLTLQIGDTADSYNQLQVNIGDMHVASLGIASINIADQNSAQKAIQSIKDAINSVSSTRGDLGAIQNRLDHTLNNLSVMTENIQDAESTIRDTDVAEEMMSYVKNNILVQSAQAMLAQANQVPQGVLQLLG